MSKILKMKVSTAGRVHNFDRKILYDEPYMPLYEAIMNSIQAIEERISEGDVFEEKIIVNIV